jgi:hypothetical protein
METGQIILPWDVGEWDMAGVAMLPFLHGCQGSLTHPGNRERRVMKGIGIYIKPADNDKGVKGATEILKTGMPSPYTRPSSMLLFERTG